MTKLKQHPFFVALVVDRAHDAAFRENRRRDIDARHREEYRQHIAVVAETKAQARRIRDKQRKRIERRTARLERIRHEGITLSTGQTLRPIA